MSAGTRRDALGFEIQIQCPHTSARSAATLPGDGLSMSSCCGTESHAFGCIGIYRGVEHHIDSRKIGLTWT